MALSVKTAIIDVVTATDAQIASALNVAYTNLYGVSVVPISNTKVRVIIIYD